MKYIKLFESIFSSPDDNYSMKRKEKLYRGVRENKMDHDFPFEYWTTSKKVAETYGDIILEREVKFDKCFTYDFDGEEYTYSTTQVVLKNLYYDALKYNKEVVYRTYEGTEYYISPETECVIFYDIVDPMIGYVKAEEGTPEYERQIREWSSDVYLIPKNSNKK